MNFEHFQLENPKSSILLDEQNFTFRNLGSSDKLIAIFIFETFVCIGFTPVQ